MGIFDGHDVASADEDPFRLGVGTHETTISAVKTMDWQDGRRSLVVTFSGDDNKSFDRMLGLPIDTDDEAQAKQKLSFIHRFLKDLEIPPNEMNDIEGPELIGMETIITLKQKGEWLNMVGLKLKKGGSAYVSVPAGKTAGASDYGIDTEPDF
jgi:hypothetical protein